MGPGHGRWDRPLMLRGEIYAVDLDPAVGSEANKRRPAVIVSNDAVNVTAARLGRGVVTVVPITSNARRVYAFQVRLPAAETSLARDSKAQVEQIRTVSVRRLGRYLGVVPGPLMHELDEALRLHLAL